MTWLTTRAAGPALTGAVRVTALAAPAAATTPGVRFRGIEGHRQRGANR